jgi:hypothetical protein
MSLPMRMRCLNMDLAKQQRDLLALIKRGSIAGSGDPYIAKVAGSPHLKVLREVVLSWRAFDVERSCRLTAALLKRHGWFDDTVRTFAETANISPFVERLRDAFLERMIKHTDPLIAAVAQFELYMLRVKLGDCREYVVDWPTDPRPVLMALSEGGSPEPLPVATPHRMLISQQLPGLVRVGPVNQTHQDARRQTSV